MEILDSHISTHDERYQANYAHNTALANELRERLALVAQGGGEKYQQRHREQGKLFVRDRIDKLLDPGSLALTTLSAGLNGNWIMGYASRLVIADHDTFWKITSPAGRIEVDLKRVSEELGNEVSMSQWLVILSTFVGRVITEPDRFILTSEVTQIHRD